MLVLTRKKDQALLLGENIKITVLSIEGDKVKLGIEAPASVGIYRQEIYEEIKKENAEAALINKDALQTILQIVQTKKKINYLVAGSFSISIAAKLLIGRLDEVLIC